MSELSSDTNEKGSGGPHEGEDPHGDNVTSDSGSIISHVIANDDVYMHSNEDLGKLIDLDPSPTGNLEAANYINDLFGVDLYHRNERGRSTSEPKPVDWSAQARI